MSVFSTVHLRPNTPMDYWTCVGLVSEESRRWYDVEVNLVWQCIDLECDMCFPGSDFCKEKGNFNFLYVNIYGFCCGEYGKFQNIYILGATGIFYHIGWIIVIYLFVCSLNL